MPDRDAIAQARSLLPDSESRASPDALTLAGTFLWHAGSPDEARRLLDKAIASRQPTPQAFAIRGWIDAVHKPRTRKELLEVVQPSYEFFEQALSEGSGSPYHLDALMGMAYYHERKRKYGDAADTLTEAIAAHEWFLPALTEKARVLVLQGDWDQALEVAQRAIAAQPQCVDALVITAMAAIAREGDQRQGEHMLSLLLDALDRREPSNGDLYHRTAAAFARLVGRRSPMLHITQQMLDRASSVNPSEASHMSERGHQKLLQGDLRGALAAFGQATQLDEGNLQAVYGTILCQVEQGQLDDAEQQLEFLTVIQESLGESPMLFMLQALLQHRKHGNASQHVALLDRALQLHWEQLKTKKAAAFSLDWVAAYNPSFLMDVARELLKHSASGGNAEAGAQGPHVSKAISLLERLTTQMPGLLEGQRLLAQARLAAGDGAAASRVLKLVLRLDPSDSGAYLMQARIALAQEDFELAQSALEQAVSHDFAVRDSCAYHIIYARAKAATGESDKAIATLEAALELPGVRKAVPDPAKAVADSERASVFLELADLYTKSNRIPEATKTVQDALNLFAGTVEEVRVLVANSKLALRRGDVQMALAMLGSVKRDSPAFAQAQVVKADVYLDHRRDKRKFVACFKALVEVNPGPREHVLLGEAYMRIQLPEKAIEAFETAQSLLRDNASMGASAAAPGGDAALALKIGRALVSTHDFERSIRYFTEALDEQPERWELRLELATLLLRLRRYEHAAETLRAPDVGGSGGGAEAEADPDVALGLVRQQALLAQVLREDGRAAEVPAVLERAKAIVDVAVVRTAAASEVGRRLRASAAQVCYELGRHAAESGGDDRRASQLYNEALSHEEGHVPALLALALLARKQGEMDLCLDKCRLVLRIDPGCAEASLMLAHMLLAEEHTEEALQPFKDRVAAAPMDFHALARLVELLYRAGKLDDVPPLLESAESRSARVRHAPGFKYCKGLYHKLVGDTVEALRWLNQARRDGEWGRRALTHMIQLYLAPEAEEMWVERTGLARETYLQGLRAAASLMREAPMQPPDRDVKILEAYLQMASGARAQVDAAIQSLLTIVKDDRDCVPALVALCTAFMIQDQVPKARNQLKRLGKMPFQHEHASDFERAWLMLAELYVRSSKFDLAIELCKRALQHNQSSTRAMEWLGHIYEKEASYVDAAQWYEKAWEARKCSSPAIGFKLAFNYLKAKRFVETVDVCHKVLAKFPEYPRIRAEILQPAREGLRR